MAILKITTNRVKGSSLVEVLVAMVIIMVAFSIAMTIFANILAGSQNLHKLQARALVASASAQLPDSGNVADTTYTVNDILVTRKTSSAKNTSLSHLTISATGAGGDTLAIIHQIR
jgi:Tfp pilus assembly protein PilV